MLKRYAELAVRVAVPLQAGQPLLVVSPPAGADVVQAIAAAAYMAGAAYVEVLYEDAALDRLAIQYASEESLRAFSPLVAQTLTRHAQAGQPILTLHAPDPASLPAHLAARHSLQTRARLQALEAYGMLRSRVAFNWSVMALATPTWASFLRPELSEKDALAWLWDVLSRLMRLDQPDPVAAWQAHAQHLMKRCQQLDALDLTELHLKAPGTGLRIGLPPGHRWFGPLVKSAQGIWGIPNLPTEEISTLPHRLQADGTVSATRPVVMQGQVVEGLVLTFSGGRVTDMRAKTGAALIQALLDTDEGATHLGEVALVSQDSLVSRERRTFYSTLIDENAACHLALGRAYPVTLQGGEQLSLADFQAAGGNHSSVHLDFMFGSEALTVEGKSNSGQWSRLMKAGQWARPSGK